MLRIPLAAGALALVVAMPALAQNTMSGPSQSPPPVRATTPPGSMSSSSMSSMTCDEMMAKAQAMPGSASGMAMAQHEISMAQMAQGKNDDAGCKMHAMKAMDAMK